MKLTSLHKSFLIAFFALAFGTISAPAHASVTYQQNLVTDVGTSSANGLEQDLGTGLSGTVGSIYFFGALQGSIGGDGSSSGFYTRITECSVPISSVASPYTDTHCTLYFPITSGLSEKYAIGTSTLGWFGVSWAKWGKWPNGGSASAGSGLFSFDPTKYYLLYSEQAGSVNSYKYYGSQNNVWSGGDCVNRGANNLQCRGLVDAGFYIDSATSSVSLPAVNTTTQLLSITPTDATTVATTSSDGANVTMTVHAYIAAGQANQWHITYGYYQQGQSSTATESLVINKAFSDIVATSTGDFYYSATVHLPIGNYLSTVSMTNSAGWWDIFATTYAKTSQWNIGGGTAFGNLYQNFASTTDNAILNALATSTSLSDLSACNIIEFASFNPVNCLSELLIPNQAQWQNLSNGMHGLILDKFPFGYLTRIVTIVTSSQTVALPSLIITMPSHGVLANMPGKGTQIDLTPWDKLLGPTSYIGTATSTESGLTLRQIIEPGWDMFVEICFGLWMFMQLIGLAGHVGLYSSSSESETSTESYDAEGRFRGATYSRHKRR